MTAIDPAGAAPSFGAASGTRLEAQLRASADRLEAAFLAEMLKAAHVGEAPADFGGGAGEAQFASFRQDMLAEQLQRGGGIGLAERLFNALRARGDGA